LYPASISINESTSHFVNTIRKINPDIKISLIKKAYRFSWAAHRNQRRKSGEPFLAHPVAVALILTEQNLDPVTIASGLLHDVLEDTDISYDTLKESFGEEVAMLVDGVTKIDSLQTKSQEQRQVETYRKMLLSMARDLRVVIIKFADRLHNLRTLKYLEPEKIRAIASETLDIYAPLAHRLGMARIKWEMEDLAFKHLNPKEYKSIVERIVESRHEREKIIDSFSIPLRTQLDKEKIEVTVVGRPKHFYSIYRKMVQRNKPFEEIYDLLAIRVITNSVQNCYYTLGLIHSMWRPIQDRFKDYIGTPKSNGYKSLHTTVMGSEGRIIEIQIRTWEMNQSAEDGIASHWLYKDDNREFSKDDKALKWLKNLIEWQKELTDSTEFYEFFKVDLFHAEIFVFTPKGRLITLPKGATVLDFAFAVHTDLGLHCIGARVDGKIEQINHPLKSGSTIEILHLLSKKPSIDWLRDVKTPKARSAIKKYLRSVSRQESIYIGKKIVLTNIKKLHLLLPFNVHLSGLLDYFNIDSEEKLFEHVGKGDIPISRVLKYFNEKKIKKHVTSGVSRLVDTITGKKVGILVGGAEDIMVRYARCCNPLPGDEIIGFITKGRGISVHRKDCQYVKLFEKDDERAIVLSWEGDEQEKRKYIIFLEITGNDRKGLLQDITSVFFEYDADVLKGSLSTDHQKINNVFQIEISNKNRLKQILRKLMQLKGIETVKRTRERLNLIFEDTKK
jgi:GTP pyrophosphokinase